MELGQKVAVITGAGGGIGRELALACLAKGCSVIAADLDAEGLRGTRELAGRPEALRVHVADVSVAEDMERLRDFALDAFGGVHLLINNAGVYVGSTTWEATVKDWQWVWGVNVMGVANAIRAFVPPMLEAGERAHVVNVASAAGLISLPGAAVYCASKHAVVSISECLHQDLKYRNAPVGVSVVCPSFVSTGIAQAARNRPSELLDDNDMTYAGAERLQRAVEAAKMSPAKLARRILSGVEANEFYILTHPEITKSVAMRFDSILKSKAPDGFSLLKNQ